MVAGRALRILAILAPAMAALSLASSLPPRAAEADAAAAAAVEPMATSVVEIIRAGGNLGAGVQIEKGLILTAAHLVANDREVTVRDDHGREQIGTVLLVDTQLDVALLTITRPMFVQVSALRCEVPPIGMPVRMVGHPMGRTFTTMRGFVASGLRSLSPWPTLVYINPRAFPGMSGGPVIDSHGDVVALVVAATSRGRWNGPAGAVPGSAICAFMPRPDASIGQGQPG